MTQLVFYYEAINICRRCLLFEDFEDTTLKISMSSKCVCCDVCALRCKCGHCTDIYHKISLKIY